MQNEFLLLISYVFVIITIHTTTARRTALPAVIFIQADLFSLVSLFGCHFIRGKALDYVVGENFGAPCSVGSASIRVDIYTAPGLIALCDVSDRCADCCPDRMDRSVCQISFTPFFISVISSAYM